MWPHGPTGGMAGRRREAGHFLPNCRELHFCVTGEQKIAFDNIVKGDPQESSNMPQNQKTAFDDIVKSVAQEGLAMLPKVPSGCLNRHPSDQPFPLILTGGCLKDTLWIIRQGIKPYINKRLPPRSETPPVGPQEAMCGLTRTPAGVRAATSNHGKKRAG